MSPEICRPLWEILVPTIHHDGRPIDAEFHKIWDAQVRAISHGLTICPPAKGEWVTSTNVISERMIPVRFMATIEQAAEIATMTLKYYDQEAVMYYRLGDFVR